MTLLDGIIPQLGYIGLNLVMAKVEAEMFDKYQLKINHRKAACIYGGFCLLLFFFVGHYGWRIIWLLLTTICMHFPVFSIALNRFRTPPRAWDYHNITDTKGSKFDIWLGKWYDEVLFGSVAGWIGLQWLIF